MSRREPKQSSDTILLYNIILKKHILKRIEMQLNRAGFYNIIVSKNVFVSLVVNWKIRSTNKFS